MCGVDRWECWVLRCVAYVEVLADLIVRLHQRRLVSLERRRARAQQAPEQTPRRRKRSHLIFVCLRAWKKKP
jgi:hypothetical protein